MFTTSRKVKTYFTTNTNTSVSSFIQTAALIITQPVSSCNHDVELKFYSELALALTSINQLIYDFAIGDFSDVAQILTMDKFNTLSILFGNLQKNPYLFSDYEEIRTTIVKTIQGLLQTVYLYANLINTQIELSNSQERSSILTNMTLLNAYIKSLKGITAIFNPEPVTVIAATIHPQYALYIKMFGYPASGVFDPDKLAECIILVNTQLLSAST
jgi:hypothetical protein